jgi:hypothetical protein
MEALMGLRRRAQVPASFVALAQLALSEIRGDVERLFRSNWAIAERCRTRRLAVALEDACDRQGLAELAGIVRSIESLIAIPRSEAAPFYPELRKKFKELTHRAEGCLSGPGVCVA